MKRLTMYLFSFALLGVFAAPATAQIQTATKQQRNDLKKMLEERYKKQNVTVVKDGMSVALILDTSILTSSYHVHYDHFYKTFPKSEWPKPYQRRNLLDEFTTEEIETGAVFPATLETGEMLRVVRFAINFPGKDDAWNMVIDIDLEALNNAKRRATMNDPKFYTVRDVPFGMHMRFTFPAFGPEELDEAFTETAATIGQYVVRTDQYHEQQRRISEKADAQKNVELKPGMSEKDVTALLGQPDRRVAFGSKVTLMFASMTVELVDDKVTDVSIK